MDPGELKPILAALVLPPAGPLLLAGLGLVLLALRRRGWGGALAFLGLGGLWLISCQATAMWLAGALIPTVAPMPPAQLARLAATQAIVVLGGGVLRNAPEYGAAQPSAHTMARLRYAAWLARRSGKPLAFAGGVGWASSGSGMPAEAEVAARALQRDWGLAFRWAEAHSRDTRENAQQMRRLLAADGVQRIALVTDAWHMPRSVLAFQAAGFEVVPAPTGFPSPTTRPLLEWLPSAEGLSLSRQVIREWLALRAQER